MEDELYTNGILSNEVYPTDYTEVLARMEKIDEYLTSKGNKHKRNKVGSHKSKKLKRRVKALEEENEQIRYLLKVIAMQSQSPKRQSWWHRSVEKSAPQIIDLIAVIIKSNKRQMVEILPSQSQLYLTNGVSKE